MSFVISFILLNQSYLLRRSSICAFIVNPLWPRPRPRPRTLLASLTSLVRVRESPSDMRWHQVETTLARIMKS